MEERIWELLGNLIEVLSKSTYRADLNWETGINERFHWLELDNGVILEVHPEKNRVILDFAEQEGHFSTLGMAVSRFTEGRIPLKVGTDFRREDPIKFNHRVFLRGDGCYISDDFQSIPGGVTMWVTDEAYDLLVSHKAHMSTSGQLTSPCSN